MSTARTAASRVVVVGSLVMLGLAPGEAATPPPSHPRLLTFDEPVFETPVSSDHRIELPGGAVGFVATDRSLPLVDVAVALRVGSFADPVELPGLASITGSLLSRAGAGDLAADELDDRVARIGARLDSFAGITRGGASLNVLSEDLDEGLDLLFDALRSPGFDADRVENTRRNVHENMRRRNEDPLSILEREWEWLLWGIDHYSTRPLTRTSLDALTVKEMRAFHRRYWHPGNLVFAVSGDVGRERAHAALAKRLEVWRAAETAAAPPWPPPESSFVPEPGVFVIDKDVSQAKVRLGLLNVSEEPWTERETAVLSVMNEILGGGGAISRIAGRLRTAEGLVYRASASFETAAPWAGEFRVFFDATGPNVARAVRLCLAEIDRLRTELAHPQELSTVQETLLAELRQSFDSAEEVAGYLAEDHLLGREPGYWGRRYQSIQSVTLEDVRAAADKYLDPARLVLLAVGRRNEILDPAVNGVSDLERSTGHPIVELPLRDPLTLEVPPP